MRIAVFGGTGPTGLLVLNAALDAGHEVTAFARTPTKLPQHIRLTAVSGQLNDPDAIARAVTGADAVISLLGPGRDAADIPPLVEGTRTIVSAMEASGVRRLVTLGTPSISDATDRPELKVRLMVAAIKRTQPAAYRAFVDIGATVRNSGLDWTIVRVPLLTNRPGTGAVARRVGDRGGMFLSRANAARYFIEEATDTRSPHRVIYLTDK